MNVEEIKESFLRYGDDIVGIDDLIDYAYLLRCADRLGEKTYNEICYILREKRDRLQGWSDRIEKDLQALGEL